MTAHNGPRQYSVATTTTTMKPRAAGSESFRKIYFNNDAENDRLRRELHYAGNRVSTSKYSLMRCVRP